VRRARIALVLVLTVAPVVAASALASPPARSALYRAFRTPSGLIGCYYATAPTFLRCDTQYETRFSGKRRCEGDYGQAFGMTARGRAGALCVGDTALDARSPVLAYGRTKRYGPYTCTSRTSGLTCTNRGRHGWTLSKQRQRLF